jgi:O-antigen/teichoic acid export membrane protein
MQSQGLKNFLRDRISPYVVTAVCRAGTQVTTFGAMLVAIRSLKAEAFGAFSVAWSTTVIGNALIYSGFFQYLLRVRDIDAAKHTVFWLLVAEGALVSVVMVLAGTTIQFFGDTTIAMCFVALAPVPTLTAVAAWGDALLTRTRRAASVSAAHLFAELAGASALFVGITLGWKVGALLAWRTTGTLAAFAAVMALTWTRPRAIFSASIRKEAIEAALPLKGSALTQTASGYTADFLLAGYLNAAASGAYRVASRIAVTGSGVFLEPLGPLTWAAMAEHERAENLAGMRRTYFEQLRLVTFFAWPTLFCLALSSRRIFSVVAREDWSNAAPVLTVLALSRIPDSLIFFLDPVLVCTGRSGSQFRMRTIGTIVFVIGVAVSAFRGAIAVAQWQLVYGIMLGMIATEVVCRLLSIERMAVLRATAAGLTTSALCVVAGDLAYRMFELPDAWRLSLSISAMALCMSVSFLLLYGRGMLLLPKR